MNDSEEVTIEHVEHQNAESRRRIRNEEIRKQADAAMHVDCAALERARAVSAEQLSEERGDWMMADIVGAHVPTNSMLHCDWQGCTEMVKRPGFPSTFHFCDVHRAMLKLMHPAQNVPLKGYGSIIQRDEEYERGKGRWWIAPAFVLGMVAVWLFAKWMGWK